MKNKILLVLAFIALAGYVHGQGTVTTASSKTRGRMHKVTVSWLSSTNAATSSAVGEVSGQLNGTIRRIVLPASGGTTNSTYLYDAESLDVLQANGVTHTNVTRNVYAATSHIAVDGVHTLTVTNVPASTTGTLILYIDVPQ